MSREAGSWPGASWRSSRSPFMTQTRPNRADVLKSTSTSWYMRHTGTPYTGSVYPPNAQRTEIRDASSGAPMRGVSAWPVSRPQTAYMSEFEPKIACTIPHPYNPITSFNMESVAHNLITGSAFAGNAGPRSEYKRQFAKMNTFHGTPGFRNDMGLRSEEMITVGLYTPIKRSV